MSNESFEVAYKRWAPMMRSVARKWAGKLEEADLFQEFSLNLYKTVKSMPDADPTSEGFGKLVRRNLTTTRVDLFRKFRVQNLHSNGTFEIMEHESTTDHSDTEILLGRVLGKIRVLFNERENELISKLFSEKSPFMSRSWLESNAFVVHAVAETFGFAHWEVADFWKRFRGAVLECFGKLETKVDGSFGNPFRNKSWDEINTSVPGYYIYETLYDTRTAMTFEEIVDYIADEFGTEYEPGVIKSAMSRFSQGFVRNARFSDGKYWIEVAEDNGV